MNVTVKVWCQLAVFLVAFVGQGIAKRAPDPDLDTAGDPDGGADLDRYSSEFTDDVIFRGEEFDYRQPARHDKEKRDTDYRNKRYAEDLELVDDKKKYEKEQYWNEGDVEVEEEIADIPEDRPNKENDEKYRHYDSTEDEEIDARPKSRRTRQVDERYERRNTDERYDEPEATRENSRRYTRSVPQYEVHERQEEDELMTSESRVQRSVVVQETPPDRVSLRGVEYVRVPDRPQQPLASPSGTYYVRRDGSGPVEEHYHRDADVESAPPAARYSQAASTSSRVVQPAPAASHRDEVASSQKADKHASAAGGHEGYSKKHSDHGRESEVGSKSAHHNQKGAKGSEGHEKRAKHYDEGSGKKHSEHDSANHRGGHQEAARGSKGAKFDEKKAHDRGHATKGYHNKYHKDEIHKEHKFYDDYHKSGSHSRYGDFNAKHAKNSSGNKKGSHHKQGKHQDQYGKKGQSAKGYNNADHRGYNSKKGYQKQHAHKSDYGKKGGRQGGKSYGYKQ